MYRISTFLFGVVAAMFLVAGQAKAADLPCDFVVGSFENIQIDDDQATGDVTGDVEGTFTIDLNALGVTPEEAVVNIFASQTTIETEDGDVHLEGAVLLMSLDPAGLTTLWIGWHEIVGGTGDFEGAFGGLRTFGLVSNNNPLAGVNYQGILCLDDAE